MSKSMWQQPALAGEDVEAQSAVLGAVADASRLTILHILRDREYCVTDIVKRTGGLSQPNVSKHLSVLHGLGLVERDKRGREVFYSLADGVEGFLGNVGALVGRVGA